MGFIQFLTAFKLLLGDIRKHALRMATNKLIGKPMMPAMMPKPEWLSTYLELA
jgi:hypothetical protein